MDFLSPLFEAARPIPTHAMAALLAVVIGAVQLLRTKGGTAHRWMGRIWVGLMTYVALSSFFIWEIKLVGPFSPIHLLSVFALGSLIVAVKAARAGNISLHKRAMTQMYFLALVLTGLLTLLPGRVMFEVISKLF